MIATVEKSQLNAALSAISQVVNGRTMAILSNVLLVSKDDKLELTGSNGDCFISASISAVVDEPWSLTVPAERFKAMVGSMPDGEVEISMHDRSKLRIKAGGAEMKLSGIEADAYPALPNMEGATVAPLKQTNFYKLIHNTQYAMSDDKTRQNLMGLLMVTDGVEGERHDQLVGVASSGKRLSKQSVLLETPVHNFSIFVPNEAAKILSRIVEDCDEVAEIGVVDKFAQFIVVGKCGVLRFITKLSEYQFPPSWKNLAALEPKIVVEMPKEELVATLTRAALVDSVRGGGAKVYFFRNQIQIKAGTSDTGECNESIDLKYEGEPARIIIDASYILDVIKCLSGDTVKFGISDERSPGIFKEDAFTGIVMVMVPNFPEPAISAQPEPAKV